MLGKINQVLPVGKEKKKTLPSVPFLILMDMVLLFIFQGLDASWHPPEALFWQPGSLEKSPNMHILVLCDFFPPFFCEYCLSLRSRRARWKKGKV